MIINELSPYLGYFRRLFGIFQPNRIFVFQVVLALMCPWAHDWHLPFRKMVFPARIEVKN